MPTKAYFNWSSGKDSALALHYLQQDSSFSIEKLLTTVNSHYNRVSMHGLRKEVLEAQAKAIGIPLDILYVPENPSMEEYNVLMETKTQALVAEGYQDTIFGDIFLEDLKVYRENMLAPFGIKCHFPLWKKNTKTLIEEFLKLGFRAVIVCLDNTKLNESLLGAELSLDLINNLPENVDPCGENGEFHTFCFDGPIFKQSIDFDLGEKKFQTYKNPSDKEKDIVFGFCDVVLK